MTDSSNHNSHELNDLSSNGESTSPETTPPPGPNLQAGAPRVRFNSSANRFHQPVVDNYDRLNDNDSTEEAVTDKAPDEVEQLFRAHTMGIPTGETSDDTTGNAAADKTEDSEPTDWDEGYAATGSTQGGVFYHLLQTYKNPEPPFADYQSDTTLTPPKRPGTGASSSGTATGSATPKRKKWYEQEKGVQSAETLATLIGASRKLANPNSNEKPPEKQRPQHKRTNSGTKILSMIRKNKQEQDAKIKVHIADIVKRQQYIIKMCRALMLFGAPTHRLEEYLATTAKVLDINSQFLYIPGCMVISFDDVLTHTAEVKMVRTAQGVNLGKLKDCHDIYKEVLHDVISLDEALERLTEIIMSKDRHPVWLCVLMYGLASTAVSCFFKARLIDMPIIFVLGIVLGVLQLVIAPMSRTYSTVFEISATILMSFLARAFGSINNGQLFCFSAIAQSAIALILPGFMVLSSALELQSKAIVPGSIRLIYAIIYSLFLGYGITVGTALYGAMDDNATTDTQCHNTMNPYWNFLFVPLYIFFTTFTVQAKYKQMPVMIGIGLAGYVVNFWSAQKFSASAPIAYTFGAFTIGVLANLYSRLRHGVAAAVLLPAVYVQVPGSLASSGSIASALTTASSLIKGGEAVATSSTDSLNSIVFNVAASMIQIAIGIATGLFMSALLVYPLGKRRSGLWTL